MNLPVNVSQKELLDVLLNIAPSRPVYIWGAPGIGKSALVEKFAELVGMPCVSLLGSQLAPEDIIGIPQIQDGVSAFLPPKMIARKDPYILFLDELNACSQEVQKAFYSLIYERRVGEYHLPAGSVVIGAGNRASDNAIVKTMSSALLNRMFHVQLKPNAGEWLAWAYEEGLHPLVTDYITQRPDHLFAEPPKTEEPFSTPRSWHMLSDAIKSYEAGGAELSEELLRMLAYGCISPNHAGLFVAFSKQVKNKYMLNDIIKGTRRWPEDPADRDLLYFLAQSFRARLIHDLPANKQKLDGEKQNLSYRAKTLIKELSQISYEIARVVVDSEGDEALPDWFLLEVVRDLPRLLDSRNT